MSLSGLAGAGGDNVQAHTDAKDGNFACEVTDGITADARVGRRVARSGTDNELGRLLLYQLLYGNFIVSEDVNGGALQDKILVDVPGERVIIINQDEIRRRQHRW